MIRFLLAAFLMTSAGSALAEPNPEPFPDSVGKKGLQVQMVDDALALGVKHAALNVNLSSLLAPSPSSNAIAFSTGSKLFHFRKGPVAALDREIKKLSDHRIVVSLILLAYKSGDDAINKLLLHPKYDPAAPNHLGAFNTASPEGREALGACVEFLAERYSRQDNAHGRVWNYIIGNEVNSHWFWYNMGRATMPEVADEFEKAVRICHQSVRKHSLNARVYLSLEHHWNIRYPGGDEMQAFAGYPFLEYFAQKARAGGDYDWHLAFHPYPENLFEPRTWNDKSATLSTNTPRITFKNLEMLPRVLARPEFLFNGKPRRIILSEQGFHSAESEEGQILQAAAYCYAWQKTAQLPGIDAFILHRHVDHGNEGGLNLGLWTRNNHSGSAAEPLAKKKIYEVFRLADTPEWRHAFEFALPVIGIGSWDEIAVK